MKGYKMNDMIKALVNEALSSEQAHEYSINDEGNLSGFGHEVSIYERAYIVEGKDCSSCDGSHVSCHEFERVTTDPAEALENLELVNSIARG
jgi:hypothetical protein